MEDENFSNDFPAFTRENWIIIIVVVGLSVKLIIIGILVCCGCICGSRTGYGYRRQQLFRTHATIVVQAPIGVDHNGFQGYVQANQTLHPGYAPVNQGYHPSDIPTDSKFQQEFKSSPDSTKPYPVQQMV